MTSPDQPSAPRKSRALLVASLMLLAFNLRPSLAALGPVLPEVVRDAGLSNLGAGILSTAPVLCLGIFCPLAPWLGRRMGPERAIFALLVVLAAGTAMRALPGNVALFTGSILVGIGIGVINVLVPVLIKRDFGNRVPLMMAAHSMMLCAGGTLGAAVSVPIEQALDGSWSASLAAWAIPALAALLLWLPHVGRGGMPNAMAVMRVRGLWRNRLAWDVSLFMAFQSAAFYAGAAWLPTIMRARGLSPADAGLALSVSILVQIVSAFATPPLAMLGRDQRPAVLISQALLAVGIGGFLFAPLSWTWAMAVILGLGQGALFALALTMILLRARDAHVATQLSSMVQGVGYTVAAWASLVCGLVYGTAHGRESVAILFAVLSVAGTITGFGAGRNAQVAVRVESRA